MRDAVLLSGYLSAKQLALARYEILQNTDSYMLILDSPGGDLKPTLDFVVWLDETPRCTSNLDVIKIYRAESAAAFIALALKPRLMRVMFAHAVLSLHRGSVTLDTNLIDLEHGMVSDTKLLRQLMQYEQRLREALISNGLASDESKMAELYGSNWLRLSATECLRRHIVDQVFY